MHYGIIGVDGSSILHEKRVTLSPPPLWKVFLRVIIAKYHPHHPTVQTPGITVLVASGRSGRCLGLEAVTNFDLFFL